MLWQPFPAVLRSVPLWSQHLGLFWVTVISYRTNISAELRMGLLSTKSKGWEDEWILEWGQWIRVLPMIAVLQYWRLPPSSLTLKPLILSFGLGLESESGGDIQWALCFELFHFQTGKFRDWDNSSSKHWKCSWLFIPVLCSSFTFTSTNGSPDLILSLNQLYICPRRSDYIYPK